LDKKWLNDHRKIVQFVHIHWRYHNAFTVGLKERMPRFIGMRMN